VKNNNGKKKYAKFNGSLGFSNANSPVASNGPFTKKARKLIRTNIPPIRKIGKTSIASFFLFMAPKEQKLPIYGYVCSYGSAERERFKRLGLRFI
jgi:hypothetical protein